MVNNKFRFDHAFNTLQNVIAAKLGTKPETNFGSLLKLAEARNDKVILTYMEKLNFFRDFRNILTHKTISDSEALATPSDSLIVEIEKITHKIEHPKKVKDLFSQTVISFDITDSLKSVLNAVTIHQYSQFPVFNGGKLVGIISENGITNFLAKSVEDDLISIKETFINKVLEADEEKNSYEIISENKSIYDIEPIFSNRIKEGKTAYLLLITKNGKIETSNDIVGIITPWDVPTIVENK